MAKRLISNTNMRFYRVAVLNRGEAAVRFMRTARAWSHEHKIKLEVIALFTTPDKDGMFVSMATDAYSLGDAFRTVNGVRKSSYVDIPHVMKTLRACNADALWPGWGFLAESPELVDACNAENITFIGPNSASMRMLGDKIAAKRLAEANNIAVSPWSKKAVKSYEEVSKHADRIGFPVLLKAAAGGGGRGIRIVRAKKEIQEAFLSASTEAAAAFGDDSLFVEAFIEKARHIEVQILADHHGNIATLGTRDCSVQRRNQKVIEEAPAPNIDEKVEKALCDAAAKLAEISDYVSVGTVEFLLLPDEKTFYFLEMNTRLQVEHTVTEEIYRIDLIAAQLDVAQGKTLPKITAHPHGVAIQTRINAEDPDDNFAPRAGKLLRFAKPDGRGVRVDAGFSQGDVISSAFDSNIAKLIVWGTNRSAAIARMHTALMEFNIALETGLSNRTLLIDLIARSAFRTGPVTTRWLGEYLSRREHPQTRQHLALALAIAAIGELQAERQGHIANFVLDASKGVPQRTTPPEASSYRYLVGKTPISIEVACLASAEYRVSMSEYDWSSVLQVEPSGERTMIVTFENTRYTVVQITTASKVFVEIEGVAHTFSRTSDGRIRATLPASVTNVHVAVGNEISIGDRLVTLEVMKMELPILSPVTGRVLQLHVHIASQVAAGDVLVELEEKTDQQIEQTKEKLFLSPSKPTKTPAAEVLRAFLLGFDVDPKHVSQATNQLHNEHYFADANVLMSLLQASVAQDALFLTGPSDLGKNDARESSRIQLLMLARHPDTQKTNLSEIVLQRVTQLFSHYGVSFKNSSQEQLQDTLLRIFQTRQSRKQRANVYMALLDGLTRLSDPPTKMNEAEVRIVLELFARLAITNRGAHLSSAAWDLCYQWYDLPKQASVSKRLERMARIAFIALLDEEQSTDQQNEARNRIVGLPWGSTLGGLASTPRQSLEKEQTLLQVITQRRYPKQTVSFENKESDLFPYVRVETKQVFATLLRSPKDVIASLKPFDKEAVVDVVLGCYIRTAMEIDLVGHALAQHANQKEVRIYWGTSKYGVGCRVYRHIAGALREDLLYRDLHPSAPEAQEIKRWSNFEMARLPTERGVVLLRVEDKNESGDERLVAIVEVERFRLEQDEKRLRAPKLEQAYLGAARALRMALREEDQRKMAWNRIVIYVTPTVILSREIFRKLSQRLWPPVLDLALEKVIIVGTFSFDSLTPPQPLIAEWSNPVGLGPLSSYGPFTNKSIPIRTSYERKVMAAHRRRLFYPYEIIRWLTSSPERNGPTGHFIEYDLCDEKLEPVNRAEGLHSANLMVGVISTKTAFFSAGFQRILIIGDPTNTMGSLAEPECVRVIAAIELAEELDLPIEWVSLSSGAKISFDSGTENLDWTAKVLRKIITFTQNGGVIHVIVDGPCVGAQSYWNAEATMMMHCKGTLIMTARGYMVLTGKRALEYAGSVAAESNLKIGGIDIMEPNGEAQYIASDLHDAYRILFAHYAATYREPKSRYTARQKTADPLDRDVSISAYSGEGNFKTIGEIFSEETNPGRKRPFEIRPVMREVLDADFSPIERWAGLEGGETAVIMYGRLGGHPITTIGIESMPVKRKGQAPVDGPESWMSGTLFPHASRKVARAINAANATQPIVVLANLSGFDGSPESLRHRQLELGAEIGRAVVNFDGPIIFCIISRYHGGAYVVFSQDLNPNLETIAVEGTFASVIGGAPAAAVVFPKLIQKRVNNDPRVLAAHAAVQRAGRKLVGPNRKIFEETRRTVESEIQSEVGREFDRIHSIERAMKVGSLSSIISVSQLRPTLIKRVEAGISRFLNK